MRKNTDIESVRRVAKLLLYIDIVKCEELPLFQYHPYFSSCIVYDPVDNVMRNTDNEEDLKHLRKIYSEQIDNSDLIKMYVLINAPYRPLFFREIEKYLNEKDYNTLLSSVWTETENPNQDANVSINKWIRYFKKANKDILMDEEEREKYNNLQESIIIYRGVANSHAKYGLSWTDNPKVAEWFAKRFGNKKAYILKTVCKKEDVLAYFTGRNEDEIVLNINNIDKKSIERIELNGGEE